MDEKKKICNFKNILIILISLVFLGTALFMNRVSFVRVVLSLMAVFCLSFVVYRVEKKYFFLSFFLFLSSVFLLDSFVVLKFRNIPVFTYNIVSDGNISVYHGLGVRVWQCSEGYEDLKSEVFYNKGFLCDPSYLNEISVNQLLSKMVEEYEEYANKYVKIVGRVSLNAGDHILEMKAYDEDVFFHENELEYDDSMTLRFILNSNETHFSLNEEVTVIGIIKNREIVDSKQVIYVYDSMIVSD